MRSRLRRFGVAVFALTLGIPVANAAEACSICLAGDPRFSNQGAAALEQGQIAVGAEVRGWRKTSGLLPGEDPDGREVNTSQRLDLYASWGPFDRLTLTLDVPFVFNEVREEEPGQAPEILELDGFGDISLTGSLVVWRDRPVLPATWVELQVLVKFPTGESSQSVGGHLDPHIQKGTGSWDLGLGVAGAHRFRQASVYASVFYRENRRGSLQYTYGDVVLANAAVESAIGHAFGLAWLEWLTLGVELNFRQAERDIVAGQIFADSGGSILYATPSWRARLPLALWGRQVFLRSSLQVPLTQKWLDGRQHEGLVWSTGFAIRL